MREGGGVEIGLETGTSFGQCFARIRNANFVIFVLEYQKEQTEKNQVRIVFILTYKLILRDFTQSKNMLHLVFHFSFS